MNQMLILLVEDNPDDIELTLRGFKKNNFSNEIVVAHDGKEALDFLFGTGSYEGRDMSKQPTLVLLDINMPKIGGLEVLKRIRADERTRRVPVVLLTSSNEDSDINTGYDLGANSYVRKPVDFVEFTEAVRQLNLYWLLLNKPARNTT
jgi:two-component system response regulator